MSQLALFLPPASCWICARDPRLRIVAAGMFALVTVNFTHLFTLLIAVLSAMTMLISSGGWKRWRQLLALESVMLLLLLTLPLTVPGAALFTVGGFSASRTGLTLAITLLLKANAIVVMMLALVGSLEPMQFGHALARLGVPEKLVHLLLLTIRQIHLLYQEFIRLRQAMRARAFVPRSDRHTWHSYGWLMGMLLVRSLTRSQRLAAAMRLRGFHGRLYLLDAWVWQWQRADTTLALGFALFLSSLIALESW
ncbi:cobalt ECF transporter T component CbiQ [Chromatium okenii]|uniref:cobalt ECF transporter T component CbiQ n=1 Tax=Chromatium okenii TaxID=61644 RepID=UPI0026ED1707|nr:cobalt ECF transporter T component CbiQ [Chromatium okenii]MBV5308254.1 cobalt ECF transporter T component CbiQ [Chromatium okenii]